MRAIVFGASGMLGEALVSVLPAFGITPQTPRHWLFSIEDERTITEYISGLGPEVVINCAGVIPGRMTTPHQMIGTNALGPHVLAHACRQAHARLLHVSTDCVFADDKVGDPHQPGDDPDAMSLYGRSKAIGEPAGAVVVRTSFVGPRHGLWAWLRQREGQAIEGWDAAWWSGSTVGEVAHALAGIARAMPPDGKYHLATEEPITKALACQHLIDRLGLDVIMKPVDRPYINRALAPSPGMVLRPFFDAMRDYAEMLVAK